LGTLADMNASSAQYASFLIRLWREPPPALQDKGAGQNWLVQVEHIPSGKKAYFTSLEEWFAFMRAQLRQEPGED